MNIHEYQAKAILRKFGVPVPDGHVCYNGASAREWAKRLGAGPWVVKAQIHAGGRGKGGGVKLAKSPEEAERIAGQMIGMKLVTHQTGPEGREVKRVLVEEGLQIARELYLGLVIDRSTQRPVLMVSPDGGVEIEKVAPAATASALMVGNYLTTLNRPVEEDLQMLKDLGLDPRWDKHGFSDQPEVA